MANIQRYEPWSLLNQFQQDVNRMFSDLMPVNRQIGEATVAAGQWAPLVDIKEDSDKFVVMADIPGVDPNQIKITMENQVLAIEGEKVFEKQEEKDNYTRKERFEGRFYRQFTLPASADSEKVTAQCRNGVLAITIPKKEQAKPRQIEVKAMEEITTKQKH